MDASNSAVYLDTLDRPRVLKGQSRAQSPGYTVPQSSCAVERAGE